MQSVNVRRSSDVLSGEHLAQSCSRELGNTGVLLEESIDVALEAAQVGCRDEGLTTVLYDIEQDLVLLVVSREEDNLESVLEVPYGAAVHSLFCLLDL